MFSRAILDELPDCIFEHFEIAQAEQRQLQNFKTYKMNYPRNRKNQKYN